MSYIDRPKMKYPDTLSEDGKFNRDDPRQFTPHKSTEHLYPAAAALTDARGRAKIPTKRAPSAYNLHVQDRVKNHGDTFKEATQSWASSPKNPKNKK